MSDKNWETETQKPGAVCDAVQVTSPQVYTKKGVPISVVDTAQVKTNVS